MNLTHEDLRRAAIAWLKRSNYVQFGKKTTPGAGCSIVISEMTTTEPEIPDAIGWRWGRSVLVECKTSRSDFFVDAKKPHRLKGSGPGETRYFLTTPGLVKEGEVPGDWGLLELEGKSVKVILEGKRRDLEWQGHVAEKKMLLSAVRRIRMREFLIISEERLEQEFSEEVG